MKTLWKWLFAEHEWNKAQIIDQVGHVVYALCLMLAFVFPLPPWFAALLVMVVAFERELEQHKWDWRTVGKLDLFFWALCCAVTLVVFYFTELALFIAG